MRIANASTMRRIRSCWATLSRVSSFDYLGTLCLMPLGYLVIGPLAGALGNKPTAALATVITLIVAALVASGREVRALR